MFYTSLKNEAAWEDLPRIGLNQVSEEVREREDLWASAFIRGQDGNHKQKGTVEFHWYI